MSYLNIELPKDVKIAVVGDIHGHAEQYFKLVDKINPSKEMKLVSVGDIKDKGFGIEAENKIIDHFRALEYQGFGNAILGNHELKWLRWAKRDKNLMTEQMSWIRQRPKALSFKFIGGTKLTVVHAGVTHKTTWDDLEKNSEVCYVRTLDEEGNFISLIWKKDDDGVKYLIPKKPGGVSWHETYDGRFGYIAAGHDPQEDGVPKYYSYSCNLDTAVFKTGKLTAQIFSDKGLEDMIQVEGTAKNPDIGEIRKDD